MDPRRRWRRWLLLAAAVALTLGGAGLFAGWRWLQGPGGTALVREQVLSATKELAGRVELGTVELDGDRVTLRDLKLFTPEGELVAEVKRVAATVELLALLRDRLRLSDVEVDDPRLLLVEDERGLNLSRAVASRRPATPGGPPRLRIEVRGLTLGGGSFDYTAPTRRVTLTGLSATGSADATTSPLSLESELALKGALERPLVAPLELHLTTASPTPGTLATTVTADLGRSRVAGRVSWPALEVAVTQLTADPETVRAFLPDWPVKVPVTAEGRASPKSGAATARAGKASLSVSGRWDLAASTVEAFEVGVAGLDLSELFEGGQPSRLTASAKGALQDARPDSLAGSVTAEGAWDAPDGRHLATVALSANAKGGALDFTRLAAELPGLALTGSGRASRRALALTARAEVTDLSRLSAAVAELTGAQVPLSGNGTLDLTLSGSPERPGVTATGRLGVLRVGAVTADLLDVDVALPDLTHPLDADGVLSAKRLRVGERAFDEVTAKVATQGRQLDAELTMRGLANLTARLSGEMDRGSEGLTLTALGVTSPEAEWALEAPARITWAARRIIVEPLALRSGPQRLALQATQAGQRLDGSLTLERLDLGKLPRVLAPEALGLGGELSAKVTLSGAAARPDAQVRLTLSHGSLAGVRGLDASAEGTWRTQRAAGRLTVSGEAGAVTMDFDLPVDAWLAQRDEAWRAHLSASRLDLSALAALAKRAVPVSAQVTVEANLEGTTRAPRLMLTAEAPTVTVDATIGGEPRRLSFQRVAATVSTREGGLLGAVVSASGLGGTAAVTLTTPFTLPGLWAKVPTAEELRATPVTLGAELTGLELKRLHELGLTGDDELAGTGSAKAALHGTSLAPRGTLTVQLARAVVHPLHGLDLTARLTAADDRTALAVETSVAGKPALTAEVSIAAPVERLDDVARLGDRPITGTGALNPLELSEVLRDGAGAPAAKGTASASFEVSGTLDAPEVYVAGSVQRLQFASVPLGSARFTWKGPSRAQSLSLALGGEGRDDLKVRGTVGVDLSLATLRRGLDLEATALKLTVDARDLDLGFLSGATADVRVVAGRLTMQGDVEGTVGLPRFKGDATWSKGRLALLGLGDYRDLELAVHATNDLFDIQRLRVRAGAGVASLKATATRAPGREVFHLVAEGTAEKFPLVVDDQLVATLTFKASLAGEITDELVDIRSLELPRLDVSLPEVKRRDLQTLERPRDVFVVRGGERVSYRARQAARAKAREEDAAPRGRAIRVLVSAPRNLWVRSSDLNLELGLSENFRIERAEKVQIFGEAYVLRGRISVIGREFEVQKSSQLRFAGPATEPYVNVVAVHANDREKVKVTVTVVGRGTAVALKTSSDPPMTESDIYTLLATGRRELRRGTGASFTAEQAVSVVGNVAAAQLKQVLAKKLPIDVLNFEAAENFQSVRLDVGKYLSDWVYLGYTFQPGAHEDRGENQHAGRLEFQFSRHWAVEAYAGTAPAAGANVMWSRDF